jgi:hypothetical protein
LTLVNYFTFDWNFFTRPREPLIFKQIKELILQSCRLSFDWQPNQTFLQRAQGAHYSAATNLSLGLTFTISFGPVLHRLLDNLQNNKIFDLVLGMTYGFSRVVMRLHLVQIMELLGIILDLPIRLVLYCAPTLPRLNLFSILPAPLVLSLNYAGNFTLLIINAFTLTSYVQIKLQKCVFLPSPHLLYLLISLERAHR